MPQQTESDQNAQSQTTVPAEPAGGRWLPGLTPVALFLVLLLAYVLVEVRLIVIVFLVALLLATLIERPVEMLERRLIPRPVGILLIYGAIIGALVLFGIALVPELAHQMQAFANEAPEKLRDLQNSWRTSSNPMLRDTGVRLLGRAQDLINNPPSIQQDTALGVVTNITTGIVSTVSAFVMTFYLVMERALIRRVILAQLSDKSRPRVERVWNEVEHSVGDWLRGQLMLCVLSMMIDTAVLGILGVPFWPLLGVFMGFTVLIPLLGPWLSGVPTVTMALTVSWQTAAIVLVFIILRQIVFDLILSPRVMKHAVGVTPLTVVVAVFSGSELFGPIGALMAIPIAAAIQVILADYFATRRAAMQIPAPTEPSVETWRWLLSRTTRGPAEHEPGSGPASEPPKRSPGGSWQGDRLARAGLEAPPDIPESTAPPPAPSEG